MPSLIHERVVDHITDQLKTAFRQPASERAGPYTRLQKKIDEKLQQMYAGGQGAIQLVDSISGVPRTRSPDASFYRKKLSLLLLLCLLLTLHPDPEQPDCPTLVVEVAYSRKGFHIKELVIEYLTSTQIQCVVVVNVPYSPHGSSPRHRLHCEVIIYRTCVEEHVTKTLELRVSDLLPWKICPVSARTRRAIRMSRLSFEHIIVHEKARAGRTCSTQQTQPRCFQRKQRRSLHRADGHGSLRRRRNGG
jgi:Uma2 family endonuclease